MSEPTPFDPNAILAEALRRQHAGDVNGAAPLFRQLVERFPTHPDLLETLGTLEQARGNAIEALSLYKRALTAAPNRTVLWRRLGEGLLIQGQAGEALNCFDCALALAPGEPESHLARANALRALSRPGEALTAIDAALKQAPKAAGLLYTRGNLLMDLERFSEAVAAFDAALAQVPDHGPSLNNRGNALRALGRTEEARASFEAAVAVDPNNAPAWYNLADALTAQGAPEQALPAFARALARKPEFAEAYAGRGIALLALERPGEALIDFNAAILHAPGQAEYRSNKGTALVALDRPEEAVGCFSAAIACDPTNPTYVWNKALALLSLGDFAAGWPLYEARWQRPPLSRVVRQYPQPRWTGLEPLTGKTIFVYAEQGLGDTIQFCRFLTTLTARGATVVFEAPTVLHPLLATLSGNVRLIAPAETPPDFDTHLPLMSLPLALGITADTIPPAPYLAADPARREAWRTRLGERKAPRIGLICSGRPQHENDRNRSIAAETLAPLTALPFSFHLLQTEIRAADAQAFAARANIHLHTEELSDFADTAALCAEMDLTIAVDTAGAHLAAALGAPTWILLPFAADWRWLRQTAACPWYASARLWRQTVRGDWSGPIDEIVRTLQNSPTSLEEATR